MRQHSPVRLAFLSTRTGTIPNNHVMPVNARVRGRTGLSSTPMIPSPRTPPSLIVDVRTTRAQVNAAEYKNMRRSRCRRTFLTSGSYVCDAGGTVGAALRAKLDGSAFIGVDGPAAEVDIVVVGRKQRCARRVQVHKQLRDRRLCRFGKP